MHARSASPSVRAPPPTTERDCTGKLTNLSPELASALLSCRAAQQRCRAIACVCSPIVLKTHLHSFGRMSAPVVPKCKTECLKWHKIAILDYFFRAHSLQKWIWFVCGVRLQLCCWVCRALTWKVNKIYYIEKFVPIDPTFGLTF